MARNARLPNLTEYPDGFRETIRDAEDAFWLAIAKAIPDAKSGDMPPDVATTFAQECAMAACAWYDASVPAFDVSAFFKELVAILPRGQFDGWVPSYEYPGYLAFKRRGFAYEVQCTPDHECRGAICFDVVLPEDGCRYGDGSVQISAEIPWPRNARTVDSFMAIMRPLLDRWKQVASGPSCFDDAAAE